MQLSIVLMGVSGCGKTEIGRMLSAKIGVSFVEGDDYHSAESIRKMKAGIALCDEDRQSWLDTIAEAIAAKKGSGCCVACSALKRAYRGILLTGNPRLVFVHLKGEKELIRKRISGRNHFFNPILLDSQFETLEEPGNDENAVTALIDKAPEEICEEIISKIGCLSR